MFGDKKNDGGFSVSSADSVGDKGRSDMGQLSPDTLKSVLSSTVFGRVYAFDPGDSTGICILDQSAPGIYLVRTVVQQDLFRLLSRYDTTIPSMIFYESFVSRPVQFARTQLAPQNIGAIHSRCRLGVAHRT